MPIRCAIASDPCLEFRYRHMTSTQHAEFSRHLAGCWDALVKTVLDEAVPCLCVVGNLFSTPRPSNASIDRVATGLTRLAAAGVTTLILPGPKDTPLFHAHDILAHRVFEKLEGTHVLCPPSAGNHQFDPVISSPAWTGRVGEEPLACYAPPSPLIHPAEFTYEFGPSETPTGTTPEAGPKAIKVLFAYAEYTPKEDLGAYKDRVVRVNDAFLETLDGTALDYLVLGGPQPSGPPSRAYSFEIVAAPEIFPVAFPHSPLATGARVVEFTSSRPGSPPASSTSPAAPASSHETLHQVSDLEYLYLSQDVTGQDPASLNATVTGLINARSGPRRLIQVRLHGELAKDAYHQLQLHDFRERGTPRNFYFELVDEIEFLHRAADISGFRPLRELERLVAGKMRDLLVRRGVVDETEAGMGDDEAGMEAEPGLEIGSETEPETANPDEAPPTGAPALVTGLGLPALDARAVPDDVRTQLTLYDLAFRKIRADWHRHQGRESRAAD